MPAERRGLAAQAVFIKKGGRGEMTKAPISLQDLILMRVQLNIFDPVEASQGGHPWRVLFQSLQGRDELLLDRAQTGKDPITKPLLAHFVPEMLNRIELGTP